MLEPVEVLILDLLEWIGPGPKSYAQAIEIWRSSRWRLPVWEQANARGFITREYQNGVGSAVSVSATGRLFLAEHRGRWPAGAQHGPSWANGRFPTAACVAPSHPRPPA